MSNQNIKPLARIDPSSFDFEEQFRLCVEWDDPDQWDALATVYFENGYILNALECFRWADVCRAASPIEIVAVETEAE